MAHFQPPAIMDNPQGWGPCSIPGEFKDMPYQPFAKGDRLGKVADWTGNTYQDRRYMNKYSSQFGGTVNQYAYYHEEDDSSFQLVDTSRVQKPIYQRGRIKFNQNKLRRERERRQQQQANMQVLTKTQKSRERDRQRQLRKWQKQFGRQMQDRNKNQPRQNREASVQVRDTWKVVEEMDFPRLAKLTKGDVDEPEDLYKCGSLEYYDKQYDRVNTKNEKRLKRVNRIFHKVTTTDDPVIRKLATTTGNVFATDAILSTLMCCCRSSYSWDVIVQRVSNKLFFDKRDDSEFDLLTVSETATDPPNDEGNNSINFPRNLALEATFINHNFSQQVLKMNEERFEFDEKNPFAQEEDEGEIASVAYKYRNYKLGNDIDLVVRCEIDAITQGPSGEQAFMNVKSLNEWDSKLSGGVDWRAKLDNQRGAVLATELKNNSSKLAKWTTAALLAGSDIIKFGYVSRQHFRDSSKHVILGTQQFKPREFANQINLDMNNAWGILRCIIDTCMKLDEGKYLIMKDPNKQVIRIYDIPKDTFESDDDDVETSSDEESDDDEEEEDQPEKTPAPKE